MNKVLSTKNKELSVLLATLGSDRISADKPKCECPERGTLKPEIAWMYEPQELKAANHEPYECPGDYLLASYSREGKEIILCSCCCLSGDTLIEYY